MPKSPFRVTALVGLLARRGAVAVALELPADARGEVLVEVDAGEASTVARVVLVTGAGEVVIGGGAERTLAARAPSPRAEGPGAYFYVRVELADGEQAWASPFWIG